MPVVKKYMKQQYALFRLGMELLFPLDDENHAEWAATSDSLSSCICDMIDALRSLHTKGFVHRDVKPEVGMELSLVTGIHDFLKGM